jgi:SSU ribosomal protein S8P
MSVIDPIADLLTRIRNAYKAMHSTVSITPSRTREALLKILNEEGYISGYAVENDALLVDLKYHENKAVVAGLKRISKPGRRIYVGAKSIPSAKWSWNCICRLPRVYLKVKRLPKSALAANFFVRFGRRSLCLELEKCRSASPVVLILKSRKAGLK